MAVPYGEKFSGVKGWGVSRRWLGSVVSIGAAMVGFLVGR